MNYYVYKHINPFTNKAFYVGKGTGDRAYSKTDRSPAWKLFVSGIKEKGLTYTVLIYKVCETEYDAFEEESKAIAEELLSGRVLFNYLTGYKEPVPNMLLVDEPNRKWDRNNTLASFVRFKRKQAKLTQKVFANKSGVGLRFLRELESGKTTMRMDTVNQVLSMFGYGLKPVRN